MHDLWFRCTGWLAAAILSLAMLAVNYGFEVAGSIPEVPTCGFLAGHSLGLLIVYPLIAALVAGRACQFIARRFPDRNHDLPATGRNIAFLGSMLYFACGVTMAIGRFGAQSVPFVIWALIVAYVFLCTTGGWYAGARALLREAELAWRTGKG